MDDMKKLIERYKKELMEMNKTRPRAEKPRVPQVIGYVDEGEQIEQVLSRLTENQQPAPEKQNSSEEMPREEVQNEVIPSEEAQNEEMLNEEARNEKMQSEEMQDEEMSDEEPDFPEEPQEDEPQDDEITTSPRFTEIPSFEQTREDITQESVPENNEPAPNASGVTDNSPITPRADFAAGGSVSEERAEGLNRQPISGTEPGEQLTGRSFPDERTPENSPDDIIREGSQTEPGNFPEPVYDDFEDFQRQNTGEGTITFRVYTAREALPVPGAKILLTKQFGDETHTIAELTSDISGQTAPTKLPAPDKELSLNSGNRIQPFALYDAVISKDGYAEIILTAIPVFDGVNSIQRAAMVPANNNITEDITEVSSNAAR